MGERFDPSAWLERVFPKGIEKTGLLTDGLDIKKRYLKALVRATGQSGRKITAEVYKTVEFYAEKEAALKAAGERAFKQEALNGQALLTSRLKNFLVYSEVQEQRKRHKGKLYRWLPSSAENPDPEHQLLYGKIFREGEGDEHNNMPGERWGCQCGIEWLDDEDMTPDDRAGMVDVSLNKTNILPPLSPDVLETMGVRNKRPALMLRTIRRNSAKHNDLSKMDYDTGIRQALYLRKKPIFQDEENKNYWHFVGEPTQKGRSYFDLILENSKKKKRLEIVHLHKRNTKSMEKMLRKYGIIK